MGLERLTHECLEVLGQGPERSGSIIWCDCGTTALTLVLRAAFKLMERRKNKCVILPGMVCPAVYQAVLGAGLQPIFIASSPLTGQYGLDLAVLKEYPADGAVALIWVHQYGCISQVEQVSSLSKKKGWVLIEDAALTFGVQVNGHAAGTLGDCGILSFGKSKIVEVGYGGAIVINHGSLEDALTTSILKEAQVTLQQVEKNEDKLIEFDKAFKAAYNNRHEDFRRGRLTMQLHNALSDCPPLLVSLNETLLDQSTPPGFLSSAGHRIDLRNDRACWWAERFSKPKYPVIGTIEHTAGTYWRFNLLVEPNLRHRILKSGLKKELKISSWFPPLYWLAPVPVVLGNQSQDLAFADSVLNLPVDGIEDWESYAADIERLIKE